MVDWGIYPYFFFVCEGTNEEAVIRWLIEKNAIVIPSEKISLDYCRARAKTGREKLKNVILEYAYSSQRPVVIYICDRHEDKEKWNVGKDVCGNEIPVIKIVTSPEIEMLLIIATGNYQKWLSEKHKNPRLNPSGFCQRVLKIGKSNIKNGENFINQFSSVEEFKRVCYEYKQLRQKSDHYGKNEITWCEILK